MSRSDTNRKNALKSTGPNTSRGKSHSRRNALKHGFFSKELVNFEADEPEFHNVRSGVKVQLKPGTRLQEIAFDYFLTCCGRSKQAMRLEQRQIARRLEGEPREKAEGEVPDVDCTLRWYGLSRADTRRSIRMLEHAILEFNENGDFSEETKEFLKRGIGEDYLRLLEEWTPPMSIDAILMAEHRTSHNKIFGPMRHSTNQRAETSSEPDEKTKVVIDPKQRRQMVCKLLELRRQFLQETLTECRDTLDERPDSAQSFDFNPRFLVDANREMRRALDWFLYLKEKGL